jgi:hypothetical protein
MAKAFLKAQSRHEPGRAASQVLQSRGQARMDAMLHELMLLRMKNPEKMI